MNTLQWLGLLLAAALGTTVALFKKYYMPSTDHISTIPDSPIVPASPPEALKQPVQPSLDKIRIMAMAQQAFEGWYLPGSVHNGIRYPEGSGSYVRNNPGNCKAIGADGKSYFIHFPTEKEGFAYLMDYIHRVATGKHHAYPKGGKTTFSQYTHIYTSDPEPSATNYASAICTALKVPPSTTLDYLLT